MTFFFFFFKKFIYLVIFDCAGSSQLRAGFFSVRGLLFSCGARACLGAEHRLQYFEHTGSVAAAPGL